jgi:hypothetical protein
MRRLFVAFPKAYPNRRVTAFLLPTRLLESLILADLRPSSHERARMRTIDLSNGMDAPAFYGINCAKVEMSSYHFNPAGASTMNITTVGVDLAKIVFQIREVDARGKVAMRKQLKRSQVIGFFTQLPPCLIGMEACGGAHFWARKLTELRHTVKLIAPQFVKPYVKTNKNDVADAEAICEAVGRPNMRFVPIKNTEQQALLGLHRARQGFVTERTAQANQIRGLLSEFGLVMPVGQIASHRKGVFQQNRPVAVTDDRRLSGSQESETCSAYGYPRKFNLTEKRALRRRLHFLQFTESLPSSRRCNHKNECNEHAGFWT